MLWNASYDEEIGLYCFSRFVGKLWSELLFFVSWFKAKAKYLVNNYSLNHPNSWFNCSNNHYISRLLRIASWALQALIRLDIILHIQG